MDVQPNTIQAILELVRCQAARKRTEVVIHTRIALNAREARLLDMRQEPPLEIIRY